ncbi:MAG: family 20 glycosylhydrolase [Bacteroidales bacterium]
MKKLIILCSLLFSAAAYGQTNKFALIPKPVDMQQTSGTFRLSGSTTISYDSREFRSQAEMLALKLSTATGFSVKASLGNSGDIQFRLNKPQVAQLGKEGYSLTVSPANAVISANQPAGLFYGIQTLLQLLPGEIESKARVNASWTIPGVKITDYPRFGWRGMMLDVSRNFFTKEDVKKYIDEISRFKFNVFHWHLTDDNGWRVEINSLPKLTEVGAWRVPRAGHFGDRTDPKEGEEATYGGFYTRADIKEIIKYASDRFITIIPEIDVPGHSMAAVASYPELSCTGNKNIKVNPGTAYSEWYGNGTFKMLVDNSLNPSDEKVYEFLDKVFTELAEMFPAPYIHVGGDECYKGFWAADEGCQALMKKLNLKNVEELQGYFMNRVEQILKSKGKKLLGWDEILEGGISPEATLMSWRGVRNGIEAAKLGHDVVMTPTTFCYLDYQQGEPTIEPPIYASLRLQKCYSFNPVPEGVDPKYILGGQGNLWTEQIATLRHAEYMAWPRGWALAEDFWSPPDKKDWPGFVQRVESQFERNDVAEINYSKAIYDPIISTRMQNGKMIVEMSTEASDVKIYFTTDDSMPDKYSLEYSKPVVLPEGGPVTLRVITYRNGKPLGHLITITPENLKTR